MRAVLRERYKALPLLGAGPVYQLQAVGGDRGRANYLGKPFAACGRHCGAACGQPGTVDATLSCLQLPDRIDAHSRPQCIPVPPGPLPPQRPLACTSSTPGYSVGRRMSRLSLRCPVAAPRKKRAGERPSQGRLPAAPVRDAGGRQRRWLVGSQAAFRTLPHLCEPEASLLARIAPRCLPHQACPVTCGLQGTPPSCA